jgi:hypothetical protein
VAVAVAVVVAIECEELAEVRHWQVRRLKKEQQEHLAAEADPFHHGEQN